MKNFNPLYLVTLQLGLLAGLVAQAQTSIGNGATPPRNSTMLDVNGPIAVTEMVVAVASNAATIPATAAQVQLTGTATDLVALSLSGMSAPGQQLVVINNTTGGFAATLNGQSIPAGQAVEFFYTTSGGVAGYQASTGGGNGPTLYTTNGVVSSPRTVTLSDINTLAFIGGRVGIGTTPGATAATYIRGTGNGVPATTGTTQSAGHIARFQTSDNAILDLGGNSAGGMWLQSTDATQLNANYPLERFRIQRTVRSDGCKPSDRFLSERWLPDWGRGCARATGRTAAPSDRTVR